MKRLSLALLLLLAPLVGHPDGSTVGKVYGPYVQALEREIEYRLRNDDGKASQKLGFGWSLSDRVAMEVYGDIEDGRVGGIEAELLWQLTGQGEFAWDWGALLEIEREWTAETSIFATAIAARDFGRFSWWNNLGIGYLRGGDDGDTFETRFAAQLRYRWQPVLEPALELYLSDHTRALGPVLTGNVRFAPRRALRWEFGVGFALDEATPDTTLKLNLEYEF